MAPGHMQTYVWQVPPALGPGKQDFSTVAYTYRSTVDPTAHENAGLIGAVVIGRLVSPPCLSAPSVHCCRGASFTMMRRCLSSVTCPPEALQRDSVGRHVTRHELLASSVLAWLERKGLAEDRILLVLQKATMDAYVEFPLMFTIQDESLSAFFQDNLAAREAQGLSLNQSDPNFIVSNLSLIISH